jgi:hypothetical protein
VVSTALEKRFQLSDNDVTLVQQPIQQVPPQAPVQQAQVQEEQVQTTKPQSEATKASPVQSAPQAAGTGGQDSRVLGIGWLVLPLVLGLVLGIWSYYAMTFVLGWTGVIAIIWAFVRNSNIKKNGGEWKQHYKVSVVGWVIIGLLFFGVAAIYPNRSQSKKKEVAQKTQEETESTSPKTSTPATEATTPSPEATERGTSRSNPIPVIADGHPTQVMCSGDCWWSISNVRKAPTIATALGEEQASGVFVLIDLNVENVSLKEQHTQDVGIETKLYDSAGREYIISDKSLGLDNALKYEAVPPGTNITRIAIFDVSPSATGFILRVHGWGFSDSEARYVSLGI